MIKLLIPAAFGLLGFLLSGGILESQARARQQTDERIKKLSSAEVNSKTRRAFRKKLRVRKGTLPARVAKKLTKVADQLYDCGIHMNVQQFVMLWAGSAFLLPILLLLAGIKSSLCAVLACIAAFGPTLFIRIRKNKRRETLDSQLTEAISMLCSALKAGHSFQSAMDSIAREMEGPVSEEFGRVFRETQHGMTLQDSMERMVERTESQDLEMLCTAVLIQREVGGNLAEVLGNIAGTIQSRLALKAEIKTRTASGRLSGYIVGALPVLLLLVMNVMNPEYCSMLFTTQTGNTMLIIGGIMEVTGFIVINRMVTVKY